MNGSWAGFPSTKWTDGDIKEGTVWQSTWWHASGYRYYSSAALSNVATGGRYWSSSPYPSTAYLSYNLGFYYNGAVNPSDNGNRSNGLSLRCVQE